MNCSTHELKWVDIKMAAAGEVAFHHLAPTTVEVRRVAELLPHPCLVKHTVGYSAQELSTLSQRGEPAYTNPITITHENFIMEGYALWELAKLQNRKTLRCVIRHKDQEEALLHLLERNRGSKGLNDFVRILVALELEPWFKTRAKSNQRMGGRGKGSTQLTEADRLDVRIEIARAAGVSAGNVSKVKRIVQAAIPELQTALRVGEVHINRAAEWVKASPEGQRRRLSDFRNERGIRKTITRLLKCHESRQPGICDGLRTMQAGLRKLHGHDCLSPMLSALDDLVGGFDKLIREAEGANRAA